MFRKAISIVLAWALLAPGAGFAAGQSSGDRKPTIRERVIAIPAGSIIEVRTNQKQKLVGRIGEVTNDGFLMQVARNDKVEAMTLPYPDVKSVKAIARPGETEGSKAGRTVAYVILGGLAGIGALVLILAAVFAGSS